MAEFDVTLSAMSSAASNIAKYTEEFAEQATQTYQAAQTLSESWTGDASQEFINNMEQLNTWMKEMAAVLETYSAELNKARERYENSDVAAAKFFPR